MIKRNDETLHFPTEEEANLERELSEIYGSHEEHEMDGFLMSMVGTEPGNLDQAFLGSDQDEWSGRIPDVSDRHAFSSQSIFGISKIGRKIDLYCI